jgi:hypothetical protein
MRKNAWVLLCMVWLMLCAALPAFGAESAPHVTAETTMAQLRANPAIQGSGYYTYCREMTPLMVERWKNKTLHDYFGDTDRESGIAALNLIIDNYNKGVKVTYQVYTPEEIEHNSRLCAAVLLSGRDPQRQNRYRSARQRLDRNLGDG